MSRLIVISSSWVSFLIALPGISEEQPASQCCQTSDFMWNHRPRPSPLSLRTAAATKAEAADRAWCSSGTPGCRHDPWISSGFQLAVVTGRKDHLRARAPTTTTGAQLWAEPIRGQGSAPRRNIERPSSSFPHPIESLPCHSLSRPQTTSR